MLEDRFRLGVLGAGVVLIGVITFVRFGGNVSIPVKPAANFPTGNQRDLLIKSSKSAGVYEQYLAKDATRAGLSVPSIAAMSHKFPYRVDEARHVLEVGQPAIDLAGLSLTVVSDSGALVLEIKNTTASDLAYSVVTTPTPNTTACTSARPITFNAIVIAKGATERRVECVFREGMALAVTRVESLEVPPISAWMLGLVPPPLVGIDPRVARGHQGVKAEDSCSSVVSQAIKTGLGGGQIAWRDLIDFYARHRCPTYRFPLTYKAFKSDDELVLPATGSVQ